MDQTLEELQKENKEFRPIKNIVGLKFGRLTVIEPIGRTNNSTIIYKCLCDCGNYHHASTNSLRQYVIKSCGCLKKDMIESKPFKTHGMTKTRLYKIWQDMIARCYKPSNVSYKRYGAKGIIVCDSWRNSFISFYNDVKENYADHLTLDRINPNGNYEPSNVRWATYQEQAENKKNTIYLTIDGETKTLMSWSRISNVSARLIRFRLNILKWKDIKMAVFKPSIRKIV
jgi:hypothetical protein